MTRRLTTRRSTVLIYGILSAVLMAVVNLVPGLFHGSEIMPVNPWFVAPFIALLLSIAVGPFIDRHWWEANYPAVAYGLGVVVLIYYLFGLGNGPRLAHTAVEYISFISLIGSLYVVAGGIHIAVRGRATPWENLGLLLTGAVLSNLLGTTGASMVLIRPYLRMNRYHFKPYHVVFFIFVVSNIGGALTPIGDPPLFLGYLKGIPFFWVAGKTVIPWVVALVAILGAFLVLDLRTWRTHSPAVQEQAAAADEARVSGLHNVIFLFVIIGAVFIESPAPAMLREVLMWGAALASYYTTPRTVHDKNEFSLAPIREVAILFAGIFATMIPALDWLELNARSLGVTTPGHFYWATGVLSSVLDNAPTYLNFLSAAFGLHGASLDSPAHVAAMIGTTPLVAAGLPNPLTAGAFAIGPSTWVYVQSVSIAAVFFGACTYIGNGPNFMVKSIADAAGFSTPGFFAYVVKYAVPVLLPVFALVWWLFFRVAA